MAIVPLPILAFAAVAQGDSVQTRQLSGGWVVEYKKCDIDIQRGKAIYTGGVKVTYGPTVVVSDVLELSLNDSESRGRAEGNVQLIDPDGTMNADKLEFDWKNNTGEAQNVSIKSYRVSIKAKSLMIRPDNWTFSDVSATSCDRKVPVYLVRAPKIDVQPGRRAIIRNVELQILGSTFLSFPYLRQSLDSRVTEFALPRMNFDEEGKASASWNNSFFLSNETVATGKVKMSDGLYPKYSLSITHSFIDTEQSRVPFLPEAELSDASKHSFFDSVTVNDPEAEKNYLGQSRNSVTIGTYWNERTPGRLVNNTLNRPVEAVYQVGAGSEGFGVLGQIRLHEIRRIGDDLHTRAMASSAVSLPTVKLADGLFTVARLAGAAYFNPDDTYSWGQAQFGVVYSPLKQVFLGGSYSAGQEFGNPLFESDRPYSKSSMNLKMQWGLGPTKLAFLAKYDFNQKRWYDDEFSFSQIVGCFEPYVVWRRFPNEVSFGIGFRMDEFFDKWSKRQPVKRP